MDESTDQFRKLFEIAAAKSMVVVDTLGAEPEMADFVRFVNSNPQFRQKVIELVQDSFTDEFYMEHAPVELWRYCAHYLRWSEIHELISQLKNDDINRRGAARSGVWDYILEAFADNWEGAKYFTRPF